MSMNAKQFLPLAVLAGILVWSGAARADEAQDLLTKMRGAVHSLSYAGTLVYAQGNNLSTYQINHTLENGAEKESVIRLTQGGDGKTTESVESFSLAKFQQVQPQKEQVYTFDVGGKDWVASRECTIVVARPRDRMRYLQRYCIEPSSGMLLKYSLTDRNHETVEQLMFTLLDLNTTQPAATGAVVSAQPATVTAEPVVAAAPADVKQDAKPDSEWTFSALPAGFQQINALDVASEGARPAVKQMVLSDGMSSVSVFIAPPDNADVLKSVEYSAGAMNIFTAQVEKHSVVLVGEVPVATLRAISDGLKYVR